MKVPALLLVDMQKGLHDPYWGERNNAQAEENAASLLQKWRLLSLPVVHVRHSSLEPNSPLRAGQPGFDYLPETAPIDGEKTFEKHVNSGFIGTGLENYLRAQNIQDLVILGLTTDHCVSTTTRMAGNLGFTVTLVGDATATFDRTGADGTYYSAQQIHDIHLASLHNEFCIVKTTEQVLKEVNNT